ncbi:hypothetical protein EVA_19391 [gut metagenome]|uniref:Uncharacterized protein n=1 Tax=gut metagenome TaxID=749906 RepID=J9FSE9_9ZZZZ
MMTCPVVRPIGALFLSLLKEAMGSSLASPESSARGRRESKS